MKTFKINDRVTIEAEHYKTKYSWGHKAWLYLDGREVGYKKKTYYNRTWESYEFQSVMQQIVSDAKRILGEDLKKECQDYLKNYQEPSRFGGVAFVAALGDVFGANKKESNDWKVRMIKAGFGEGISVPEDWNELDETEKETRLNKVIAELKA